MSLTIQVKLLIWYSLKEAPDSCGFI